MENKTPKQDAQTMGIIKALFQDFLDNTTLPMVAYEALHKANKLMETGIYEIDEGYQLRLEKASKEWAEEKAARNNN